MLYREIIERAPRNADAMNLFGILCAQRGDGNSALEWIDRALAIDPRNAGYALNYGKTLLQLKRATEACAALERCAALDPVYADAYHELGLARAETGAAQAAEEAFRKALSLQPDRWETHNNLALLLHRAGKDEEARLSLRRALEIEPRSPAALLNLGMVLRAQGRAAEAVEAYRAALALRPGDATILANLGNALRDLSRYDEAAACFGEAVTIAPNYADAHYNWGSLCLSSGRYRQAVDRFRAALAIEPRSPEAESGLGSALYELGRVEEAIGACRRSLALRPESADTHSQLLFMLLHSSGASSRQVFDEHREWERRHAGRFSSGPGHPNSREPDRRLRVAYVSGDFRRHSVAQFFEPAIEAHDRERFEIICYSNLDFADATTERLRRHADLWRDIHSLADDKVAELVGGDRVDVLVDLSGHTKHNRLLVFAREPAPVQVTWLGYAETTGLAAVAYRISDAIADPPGESLASETILHLPDGFLCYRPPSEAPEVSESPASVSGYVTFGSFNSPAKLGDEVIELWRRILAAVPRSRLLVKAQAFVDTETRVACLERLVAQGIAAERLDLASGTPSLAEHLAAYGRVDIALDPFPYNGTTTTCEALWMGVPVVTLAGDRHAGRVGASLLTRIGMQDFIARTPDAYVASAASLASDPARLAALRAGMRERIAASPLVDAASLARSLEQAYRSAWRRWCENPTTTAQR